MKNILKIVLLIISVMAISFSASAGKKVVKFTVSEPDAKIFVDGKMMGSGQLEILIPPYACVNVKIEKMGYLIGLIEFCNKPGITPPPKTYFYQMEKDDAYDATEATDVANVDIEIKTTKKEDDAWKLLSQIITTYFDVLEVTDKNTGYLRTAWVVQTFKQKTIRTRLIVKLASTDPLAYKIKLVSEVAGASQVSVKSDELFKEWDRILRRYKEIIREAQTRLGS
ncbi:MAG: hypothetical protein WCI48_14645 [Bacteroidota bacterium]|jgi:hypothetical protein